MLPKIILRRIGALLDTESWLSLLKVYEQWQYFPPDRLTFTGSREAGRKFQPLEFPPPNVNFSEINLDRIYGGPSVPCGGVCGLVASYLTYVPNFGESIRVINLTGQCVNDKQLSQLFSASLSLRLPNLRSLSLRIYNRYSNLQTYEVIAPPGLEHLELCLVYTSADFLQQMLQPFLPLIQKVNHLGWHCFSAGKDDMNSIFHVPLESLKIIEIMQGTSQQIGTYPSPCMPSLERLIVHNFQFSYWVDLKQIYESIGQPFRVDQRMLAKQDAHKNEFCSRTAVLNLTKHAEELEQLKRNPTVQKLILFVIRQWKWKLLLNEVLPILSTLNQLEEVIIAPRSINPDISSHEKRELMDHLHEQFQFPSVRDLQFNASTECADIYPYITFLRLFPKLDTLVDPPLVCFKDVQICKCSRRESLLCLRTLVVSQAHATCINDISRCVLRWKNLDAFLIKYEGDIEWITFLMDKLAKHKNLRHLCVIARTTQPIRNACPLPTREKIEEIAGAWSHRDWLSMFFIATQRGERRISYISAIHHDHGTTKYKELQNVSFDSLLYTFPQFYTLFWQYAKPQWFPK